MALPLNLLRGFIGCHGLLEVSFTACPSYGQSTADGIIKPLITAAMGSGQTVIGSPLHGVMTVFFKGFFLLLGTTRIFVATQLGQPDKEDDETAEKMQDVIAKLGMITYGVEWIIALMLAQQEGVDPSAPLIPLAISWVVAGALYFRRKFSSS